MPVNAVKDVPVVVAGVARLRGPAKARIVANPATEQAIHTLRRAADECVPNQPERVSVRFPTKPWANARRLMGVGKFSSADRLNGVECPSYTQNQF